MGKPFVPNGVICLDSGDLYAKRDELGCINLPLDMTLVSILEVLAQSSELEGAHALYQKVDVDGAVSALQAMDSKWLMNTNLIRLEIMGNVIRGLWDGQHHDLLPLCRKHPGFLAGLCQFKGCPSGVAQALGPQAFAAMVQRLEQAGLVAPAPNHVDMGDLRRLFPLDQVFGFWRGAPIDRYYLQKFVAYLRPMLKGHCLEIGGSPASRDEYKFAVEKHAILDLAAGGAQAVDPTQSDLFPSASWDCIFSFNVLEHCHDPHTVMRNVHSWLKPGGLAAALVPAVQRVHNRPSDYWRPMPEGMRAWFSNFTQVAVVSYGNALTCAGGLLGISYTEFTPSELDFSHPDYPLTLGAIGRK